MIFLYLKIMNHVGSVLLIISTVCLCECEVIVILASNGGTIVGKKLLTVFERKEYAAFWRIPYAEPPIHELRFKPPLRLQLWPNQIYDFSKPFNNTSSELSEDSLYLSIYMPTSKNQTFPIAVWIHELSNIHGPDFFIDENVLVVTVSYRTSILGFLNTGDEFADGNMGAKDIIMALKWIRENIKSFNGDVNRVTVIGSGESANLVGSMLLSTAAEDLFTRVVVQSGSAVGPAEYASDTFKVLNKLYRKLKPKEKFNRQVLYEILTKASIKDLIVLSEDLFDSTEVRDNQRMINSFGLTIETSKKHTFMNKCPTEVYKGGMSNNNVEVMFGYTSLENLYKLKGFVKNRELLKYLNYNFQYLLPFEGTPDEYDSRRYRNIANKIKNFYFVNGTIGDKSLRRYAKYLSDQVIYPLLRQARLHTDATGSNVYLYRFKFKGSLNIGWNSLGNLNYSGATTRDEICYLFRCKSANGVYSSTQTAERQFIKKIARLWANFAKCGNPTPTSDDDLLRDLKWDPLSRGHDITVMSLGKKFEMVSLPEQKRIKFWDELKEDFFTEKLRDEL